MRKTELRFSEEYTPGPYYPKVERNGNKLSLGTNHSVYSFSKGNRFKADPKDLVASFRIGPGSYNSSISSVSNGIKSAPGFGKPTKTKPSAPRGYKYSGKNLFYIGRKRCGAGDISSTRSNKKSDNN